MGRFENSVLLAVDVQNDFCPGGALAVPHGDEIFPAINRLSPHFPIVVATKDWHPEGHVSFASRHDQEPGSTIRVDDLDQVLWPDHCIPQTRGAEFHPNFDTASVNLILHKGTKKDLDSYSAFLENDKETPTGLRYYLEGHGIRNVYLVGLAKDVCVFSSAMDAHELGFQIYLVTDGTRGVDVPEGSLKKAEDTMRDAGITFVTSEQLLS